MDAKAINIELDSNIDAVTSVIGRIEKWLKKYYTQDKVARMILGISEILFNGIEHGNLEISYSEKTDFLDKALYFAELEKRSKLKKYRDRKVRVTYLCKNGVVKIVVKDDGNGFDWRKLPETQDNLYESHGRGVSIARYCFDEVNYNDKGNEVTLLKKIDPPNARI